MISGSLAAAFAAILPVVVSPATNSDTFTPKYAALFLLAAAGSVALVRLAVSSRYEWPARFGVGFVVVSVISAVASPSRFVGFFGLYLWGEGAVFLLALIAAWALGASLGPKGREWLFRGLLVGAGINAGVAVLQTALHVNTPASDLSGLGLFNGTQADGLLGNPVHLEALLLGALALVLGRTCRARGAVLVASMAFVALLAAALECSSERFAIVLLAVLGAYALWAYRQRAVGYLIAIAVGFGGVLVSGSGASLSQRVATSKASTTFGLRIHAWIAGVRATLEHRTILGFGPGEVRNAITLFQSPGFARSLSVGKYFTDLHNVFVNVLVMTGLLGFVLFCAFVVAAGWRVRGALAGFAALVIAVELVEPMNIGVTPLAFLALGAALSAAGGPAFDRPPVHRSRLIAALVALPCLALLPAGVMIAGDTMARSALEHYSVGDAKTANTLLPIWPVTAQALAQVYAYESIVDRTAHRHNLELSRHWTYVAALRDPSDNEDWVRLAAADLELGNVSSARSDAERALADDPLGVDALSALGAVDCADRQWAVCIASYRLAVSLAPGDPTVKSQLKAAEQHNTTFFHSIPA